MVWQSTKFKALPNDARLLYLYILTCPHQNSAGVFRLPPGYACVDLEWDEDMYRSMLAILLDEEMVHFDDETDEIFVADWFRLNRPQNPKHCQFVERIISEIRSPKIAEAAGVAYVDAIQRPKVVPMNTPNPQPLRANR